MMSEPFTGYIDKSGKHIQDGRINRPVPFRVIDKETVGLNWLHPENGRMYERETVYKITKTYPFTNPPMEIIKVGIEAFECFRRWRNESKNA